MSRIFADYVEKAKKYLPTTGLERQRVIEPIDYMKDSIHHPSAHFTRETVLRFPTMKQSEENDLTLTRPEPYLGLPP